jgi:hypothetical protein
MSSFSAKGLTNKGRALQAKAQAGVELVYTKAVIGDGNLGNQSIGPLTNVISAKKTYPLTRFSYTGNMASVGFDLTNQDVTTGFYFREIGIFATDPDEGEILYWYANAGNTDDYIPPGGGSDVIEKTFDVLIFVGTSVNVSAVINESLIYATVEALEDAIQTAKNYTDLKFSQIVIQDASTTKKGVSQLSNSTTSTSQTMAATPKAVNDARQAAITAAQAHAEEVVLPQANANAQNYVDAKTWQKYPLTQDDGKVIYKPNTGFNSLADPGFYYTGGTTATVTNAPEPTIAWFVEVFVYASNIKFQRATQKDTSRVYTRQTDGAGNWTAWVLQTPEENLWGAL